MFATQNSEWTEFYDTCKNSWKFTFYKKQDEDIEFSGNKCIELYEVCPRIVIFTSKLIYTRD